MDLAGPAYIAMKSRTDGWLAPGVLAANSNLPLPLNASNAAAGPPGREHYAPIRAAKAKVVREYGGINSSGGPQVSGRADQSDFEIEMNMHNASPVLYDHCCGGLQFEWIHLAVLQAGDTGPQLLLHIRMQDVNVTGYSLKGARKYNHTFVSTDGANPVLQSKTVSKYQDYGVYDVSYIDRMTLLYTSLSFLHDGTKTERGWNIGADAFYTVPT